MSVQSGQFQSSLDLIEADSIDLDPKFSYSTNKAIARHLSFWKVFTMRWHQKMLLASTTLFSVLQYHDLRDERVSSRFLPAGSRLTLIDHISLVTDSAEVESLSLQQAFAERWQELDSFSSTTIKVLPSVEDAFEYVRGLGETGAADSAEVHAFVTGSVHLVGRALGALEVADAL